MSGDWPSAGVANLSARVREIGDVVESVAGQLPGVIDAIGRLDADIDRLVSERGETGEALARHESQLRELTATVKRLSTQVAWIEQHIRTSGAARAADLDHADAEMLQLAVTAEKGRSARETLLTPSTRALLSSAVAAHADAVDRRRAAWEAVLAACARIVGAARGEADFRQARGAYLTACTALREADRQVAALADEAEEAAGRLAADDADSRRQAATIAAGERAERQLLTRLRTKLATALGEGALLPTWLTGVLGPMPPTGTAQRWVDVAAGLLAYRISYDVDGDEALGELPSRAPAHRRRWHADLERGIRELHR